MPVHLEVIDGPAKGRKIPLQVGKAVSVGRSGAKSMISLPEDMHLSGQHFSVGLRNGHVLLCNLSKSNPTEINGTQIDSAVLKPGECFKAGLNIFSVIGVDNPHQAKVRVGGWGFQVIPEGWAEDAGKGLRHSNTEPFCANVLVVEEALPKDYDLPKYLGLQISLGQKHLKDATFTEPKSAQIKGAEDALALTIHASARQGLAIQLQIYALHSGIVGVMTATALLSQAHLLKTAFNQLLPGLTFFQG